MNLNFKLEFGLFHLFILGYTVLINPLPDDKILESSKLKQIADDISKCI